MSRLGLQKTGERRRRRRRKAPHISISLLLLRLREEDEMWRSAPLLQLRSTNILLRRVERRRRSGESGSVWASVPSSARVKHRPLNTVQPVFFFFFFTARVFVTLSSSLPSSLRLPPPFLRLSGLPPRAQEITTTQTKAVLKTFSNSQHELCII